MQDEKSAKATPLVPPAAAADVEVAAVVVEDRNDKPGGGGSASASAPAVSLYQYAKQLPNATQTTLMLVFGAGIACTCMLSAIVSMYPEIFPTGRLTAVQMCFFSLSFSALVMRGVVAAGSWEPSMSPTFHKQVVAASEIGMALLLIFFCDRTTIIPRREKKYSEDFFTLLVVSFVAAGAFTLRQVPKKPAAAARPTPKSQDADGSEATSSHPPQREKLPDAAHGGEVVAARPPSQPGLLMNRHQTDEWKGWMQMLFLWYHYFHNVSIYNEIRVFIAAYVWMTGFGNFTYYYNREDFSLHRFLGMMWRLNLFVIFVCGLMRNEYMLYYICPLHTLFTLTVYMALFVRHSSNRNKTFLFAKMGACFVLGYVLWDAAFSQQLFRVLFLPIGPVVAYHDPYRPERDIYQEWFFRTFLDHYVWIVGMLVAYAYPTVEAWLRRLDDASPGPARRRAVAIKWVISLVTIAVMAVYYVKILSLPKAEYNATHPYTSAIPLLGFLILRNISQRVRGYYVGLFEWFGKITLETYIAQFHVWMATTGLNGSPRLLLHIIPGDYPMCDFFAGSAIMFFVSHRVAMATEASKSIFLPPKASNHVLFTNLMTLVLGCFALIALHMVWNLVVFR